jgi:hypothetical protein
VISSAVRVIDAVLRRVHDVREFTDDPDCLLRISRKTSALSIVLDDGTVIDAGEALLELHLWNDHVPSFPVAGPTIGWAVHVERLVGHSLSLLARYVASSPALSDVRGLHAVTPLASRGMRDKAVRLARRFGFDAVDHAPLTWGKELHQSASNILIAGLVWAYNPRSFRRSKFFREYVELWMSRETLVGRYSRGPGDTAKKDGVTVSGVGACAGRYRHLAGSCWRTRKPGSGIHSTSSF